MQRDGSRRFHLLDAMILVAALAAGLSVVRYTQPIEGEYVGRGLTGARLGVLLGLLRLFGWSPLLGAGTLALAAVRLRRPRPPAATLWRRPGFVATVAAAAGMALSALLVAPFLAARGREIRQWTWLASFPVGFSVAGAWAVLWLSGRWRAAPEAIDRLGRLVGALWLAMVGVELGFLFCIT